MLVFFISDFIGGVVHGLQTSGRKARARGGWIERPVRSPRRIHVLPSFPCSVVNEGSQCSMGQNELWHGFEQREESQEGDLEEAGHHYSVLHTFLTIICPFSNAQSIGARRRRHVIYEPFNALDIPTGAYKISIDRIYVDLFNHGTYHNYSSLVIGPQLRSKASAVAAEVTKGKAEIILKLSIFDKAGARCCGTFEYLLIIFIFDVVQVYNKGRVYNLREFLVSSVMLFI